ncbi:polysaccharide pyruvyl transferase CsaB [Paenibacillus donghaensis]|uniref:Polysaccharide pyruvyl transferase CsaB n=1 Tax=Paenibacillus donghaensis TaxID=414771 RepID=A0A2Z2KJY0_9BACL|nr:polysaccharide pyruvyl transferase CsaB [Paenibacillus donghaensis]ASA24515.1 polysaccharide pyruvyl transferase CsaB [Paenibacillus donghaensis]
MGAASTQIVISGYYGFRNSGDEAVLQSILIALQKHAEAGGIHIEPVVLSIDPEWTSTTYGVRSVHRMRLGEVRRAISESSGVISGGGSLLQDVTGTKSIPYYLGVLKLAQWMGKPTFIYAQGIGPVNRKWFHPMIKGVFRKCSYVSVRDEQSRQLLGSMGLQTGSIDVVPDPVMGLTLPDEQQFSEAAGLPHRPVNEHTLPLVGISVRFWEQDRRELDALTEGLLLASAEQPFHLRFLPFHHSSDNQASRYIMDKLTVGITQHGGSVSLCEDALHPQQMLREVGQCDLLIGMRLHSLIYAAGRRVPMVGVSYDPKIDHFLNRIDAAPIGRTADLTGEAVAGEVLQLLASQTAWRAAREPLIAALIQEAEAPAKRIVDYFHHEG